MPVLPIVNPLLPPTSTLQRPSIQSNPLTAWHLCSLDAPTLATLWAIFIAHTHHHPLPPTLPPAMFLAVWVLYAADRLLDARKPDARSPTPTLQPRHLFHRRHARIFRVFLILSALALVPLVAVLPHPLLRRYALLAALLALWLTLVHRAGGNIPPAAKEILAGLFFSAALFLPTPTTLLSPGLFALLGALDGLFITAWESRPPNHTPARNLRLVALTLILALTAAFLRTDTPIPQAIAAAALLLLLLNHYHPRLHPTTTRAAADAALLTPLLFLWQ